MDYDGVPLNGWRMGATASDALNDMGVDPFGDIYVSSFCGVAVGATCPYGALNSTRGNFVARVLTVSVWRRDVGELKAIDHTAKVSFVDLTFIVHAAGRDLHLRCHTGSVDPGAIVAGTSGRGVG